MAEIIEKYLKRTSQYRYEKYVKSVNDIDRPMPKVYFYIPSQELINEVPVKIQEYWVWIAKFIKNTPVRLPSGKPCIFAGPYNWTLQTFIYLQEFGFPCELTAVFPNEGIIITHGDLLPAFLKPNAKQFIVEIKPDKFLRCIYSNFVIVQNKRDPIRSGIRSLLIKSAFVNNWPQAGLIPRDAGRGDRFENICFLGNSREFLKEIDELESEIKKLGLNWIIAPREKWHDYSEIDAVVAVRPMDSLMFNRKPASRLTNAWLAGVPAILSPDVAFEDIRQSELDYIRAKNVPQVIEGLKRLMNDSSLRRVIMENGKKRAGEFSLEKRINSWVEIIQMQIMPEYVAWTKSPLKRKLFFFVRELAYKITKIDPDIRK